MFITLEGIDGSGKTALAKAIKKYYASRDDIIYVREPGGTTVGESVRGLLESDKAMDEVTRLLMFAAARRNLVRTVIAPALASGKHVISDRFYHSMIAYTSPENMHLTGFLGTLTYNAITPDITFWLHIDPTTAALRCAMRDGNPDPAIHHRVDAAYTELWRNDLGIYRLESGTRSTERLLAEVIEQLEQRGF